VELIDWVGSIGAGLRITPMVPPLEAYAVGAAGRADSEEAVWLERDGFAILARPSTVDGEPALRNALGDAMTRLVERGLPATFVYLFDEAWVLGSQLVTAVSAMLGQSYALAADGYAWRVAVGTGQGWRPHRDDPNLLNRRAPERVNVWFALTDATAERACIHVVPLDEDPGYPSDLGRTDAPLTAVRALPVAAGTALAWNANLLHWGGACSPRSCGARMAISFTAMRDDAAGRVNTRRLRAEMLSPTRRIELVASLIAGYEHYRGPDVSDEVMMWAKATWHLSDCARRLAEEVDAARRNG
jgi:hypothetical protein